MREEQLRYEVILYWSTEDAAFIAELDAELLKQQARWTGYKDSARPIPEENERSARKEEAQSKRN